MRPLTDLLWPAERLGEALESLARRAGLAIAPDVTLPAPPGAALSAQDRRALDAWIDWAGQRLGLEAEAVESPAADYGALVRAAGPAVFRVEHDGGTGFLLVLGTRLGALRVIGPDQRARRCPVETVRAAMCARHEGPLGGEIDRLMAGAGVARRHRARVRTLMLRERVGEIAVGGCWLLRETPAESLWRQVRRMRLPARLAGMLAAFAAVYGLEIVGWALIGEAALDGRLDLGWLIAWVLLVLSIVPLRVAGGWIDAHIGLDAARLIKRRLLIGALRIDVETVRRQGAGELLGQVLESQALESLAVNGGLAVAVAAIEIAFAGWVLAAGAGGRLHVALLVGWLALTVALGWRHFLRLRAWTRSRVDLTHELVEHMVGHRTRLAQAWPQRRDAAEDRGLDDYLAASRRMDLGIAPVVAGIPGGWMLLGLLGLAPAFVAGGASAPSLAVALGGLMLAHRGFSGVADGLAALSRAVVSWEQAAPLFRAGARTEPAGPFPGELRSAGEAGERPRDILVDASGLRYAYPGRDGEVLRGVDLAIHRGERVLLEGASGSGKSTLAAMLVGLRTPDAGLLLLDGLDRATLGEGWQRLATEAPQFHENHILGGSLAFNLLMGRAWPPTPEDLAEAEAMCASLGLGELIARMPSGLNQQVGETGWQLSHGERSRIYLARALLQKAPLTVLDESFGALDPETLETCLACAFDRADTLMVIAHP